MTTKSIIHAALLALFTLAVVSFAQETHDHDHDHEHDQAAPAAADGDSHAGHGHGGPPPKGMTLVSIGLSAGGAVLVSLTLLALFWRSIDGAFIRSRFRERWQQTSTKALFALGVMVVAAAIVGGVAFLKFDHHEHDETGGGPSALRPVYGGVVQQLDRFAVEMVARRTGEVRLYLTPLEGAMPSAWDIKATVIVPQLAVAGGTNSVSYESFPMKIAAAGSYLAAYAAPFPSRQIQVHLTLRVPDQTIETDFELPVRD